jgi:transglutaminase-like putative cysteine protease
MQKRPFIIVLLSLITFFSSAQDPDKNITIQEAKEEYRFVKGDKENPVQVKQTMETSYLCNDFRISIPIVEFYNKQIEVNDVNIWIDGDKVKGFSPNNDYYSVDGVFYSDARVCFFKLPLEKKGSISKVKFEKTVLDPRYFTNIFFAESYYIEKKQVSIIVPKWMKVEIKEYNFNGYSISKEVNNKSDEDIFIYTITKAPMMKQEKQAPGATYIVPHLLIMSKYADAGGQTVTYFNTLADQYKWYRQLVNQIGNETAAIKTKAEEIIKGIVGDIEKVKALYQWTQDNIRYIAYEDGIAGFKPEKAQEVLRKKYGDCKGMGNLMAEMLKTIGLDGRLCWLGTNHIAYDYSTPSLGVDNHMICAWLYKGKTYYLDATEKYIGFGEIAERIQGRQVLIEDGDKYILQNIPVATQLQNTGYEKRTLQIEGNNLSGKVVQTWKGENKEWLLSQLHEIKKEKQEDALKEYLAEGNPSYQIRNLKIININDYNADLKIEYDLFFKDAVTAFDKDLYLELDDRKDLGQLKFDIEKRKLPFEFHFKDHVVFETELLLPAGAKIATLPAALNIDRPGYSMSGQYILDKNKLTYRREIMLKRTRLTKDLFEGWNNDVTKLNEFYNNQLTITK